MKQFSLYQYQAFYVYESADAQGYVYEIYSLETPPLLIREGTEWFESQGHAELAAVGHISMLEHGEG